MLTTRGVSLALLVSFFPAAASVSGTDVVQQQNDELELDWRFLAGGGVGRRLIQTQETLLSAQGGVSSTLGWSF
jgi:hypothetical protein